MDNVEIQQVAEFESSQPEVCQDLSRMNRCGAFHCLHLNNHLFRNQDIKAETGIDTLPVVFHRKGNLTLNIESLYS